jgi:hypothetical protein
MSMDALVSIEGMGRADKYAALQASEALESYRRILQIESEQRADAARIDDVIRRAEEEIARIEQRHLTPRQLHDASTAVCDRAVLITRNVRKNMQSRMLAAKRMEPCLGGASLLQRARFAADDSEDEKLRWRFFELLERTPTSALADRLLKAMQSGGLALAELIRFEFQCREDRREFMPRFEAILAKFSPEDPIAIYKRIASVCKAVEKVDAKIAGLLKRVPPIGPTEDAVAAIRAEGTCQRSDVRDQSSDSGSEI